MNNDVNVELVQQQEEINRLKKARKNLKAGLIVNYILTVAAILAVAYLYYIQLT